MRTVASWIVVLLGFTTSAAAAEPKRIAVLEFDYGAVRSQVAAIFGTDMNVGRGLRDLVLQHLERDGTYDLVNVQALDDLIAQQVADPGLASAQSESPESIIRLGRTLGVDAVVLGSITQFGGVTSTRKITLSGFLGITDAGETVEWNRVRAAVAADLRVVDVDTGEVVAVAEGHGESSGIARSLLAGVFRGNDLNVAALDFSSREFESTLLGKAVQITAERLARNLLIAQDKIRSREVFFEARVLLAENGRVVLNAGSDAGLRVGDRLPVERFTQEVFDPVTGDPLGGFRQPVGEVEIAGVYADSAEAWVVSGVAQSGDLVSLAPLSAPVPAEEQHGLNR